MFKEVLDFSYRRTALQAFGWYLIFLLIGGVIAGLAAIIAHAEPGIEARQVGASMIIPGHVLIGILLLWSRPKDAANILLLSAGIMLSPLFGALGGLIPFAVLTTRPLLKQRDASAAA